MSEKSTNDEMALRISAVANLILNGERRANILSYARKQWGVAGKTVDDYISHAREEIKEINKTDYEENRAWVLSNLRDLYLRAGTHNNLNVQLGVLSQYSKVTGIEVAPKENPQRLKDVDLDQLEKEVSCDNVVH